MFIEEKPNFNQIKLSYGTVNKRQRPHWDKHPELKMDYTVKNTWELYSLEFLKKCIYWKLKNQPKHFLEYRCQNRATMPQNGLGKLRQFHYQLLQITELHTHFSLKPWSNGPASSRKWTQVELA